MSSVEHLKTMAAWNTWHSAHWRWVGHDPAFLPDPSQTRAAQHMKIVKPNRVTRTYTQRLVAEPARVLPLLCPVREVDWIDGWDPLLVISQSGVAERDCVFVTAAEPDDSIWYVTRHEPEAGLVEMLKITPAMTACRLTIQVSGVAGGSEATITYSHTSLGAAGDTFVASFTEAYYRQFMQDWEARMNHYLRHGSALA